MVREVEKQYPEIELAAKKVWTWHRGLLAYARQLGAISRADYEALLEKSPYYIPFLRHLPNSVRSSGSIAGQAARSPFKRLHGSGREFTDPWVAMVTQAERLISFAHKRAVLHRLALAADTSSGLGRFIHKVDRDVVKKVQPLGKFKKFLEENLGISFGSIERQTGVDPTTLLLEWYEPKPLPDGKDPIMPVVGPNGRTTWYQVDHGIYRALQGMDIYRLPGALDLFLGVPARMKRLGTTGLRASFAMVTNPTRDYFTGLIQSREPNPMVWTRNWLKSQAEAFPAAFGKRSYFHDLYKSTGVEMATPLGQDYSSTHRLGEHLGRGRVARIVTDAGKGRLIRSMGDLVDGVRDVMQIPEAGPRVAEMRSMLERWKKEGTWKEGQPISLGQSLELIRAGKQVTVDFSAAGKYARVLNQAIPFFNVAIQGPRTFLRAYKRDPLRATLGGLTVTALTLALWNQIKDEDWWRDLPGYKKHGYWHIPVNDRVRIEIPRPFEPGIMFASIPEAAAAWMHEQDPDVFNSAMSHAWQQIRPDFAPPLVRETGEQLANYDYWAERPIVPRGQTDQPYEEQYGPGTTGLAKKVGEIMGWSPRRIDHAIRGIFGGVGSDVTRQLTGPGLLRKDKEREPADIPVLGRLFARGGLEGYTSQAVTDLFDMREELRRRAASEDDPISPNERRALRYLERGARKLRQLREDRNKAFSLTDTQAAHRAMRQEAQRAIRRAEEALGKARAASSARSRPSGPRRSLLPTR